MLKYGDTFLLFQDINGESGKDGEKCISPIGAGLPLLSRLKLLKEKQVPFLLIITLCNYYVQVTQLTY